MSWNQHTLTKINPESSLNWLALKWKTAHSFAAFGTALRVSFIITIIIINVIIIIIIIIIIFIIIIIIIII